MKLISIANHNIEFETKLDIGLITESVYDHDEEVFEIKYDASDVGLPLGFSGTFYQTVLYVKLTNKNVYADLQTELDEGDLEKNSLCTDDFTAEFHLVLTEEEKIELLIYLLKKKI